MVSALLMPFSFSSREAPSSDCSTPRVAGDASLRRIGLKYWATCLRVAMSEAWVSHITRKKAIIAVMKSAKAIFQTPP